MKLVFHSVIALLGLRIGITSRCSLASPPRTPMAEAGGRALHTAQLQELVTGKKVPRPHLHPRSPGQLQEWVLAKAGVRLASWQGA